MTRRVWIIPVAIVLLSISGVIASRKISLPTFTFIYDKSFAGETVSADFTIQGVRCYGTANLLRKHIKHVPGLVSIVAYGARHRVVIEYDPVRTSAQEILHAIDKPVMTGRGPMKVFTVRACKGE